MYVLHKARGEPWRMPIGPFSFLVLYSLRELGTSVSREVLAKHIQNTYALPIRDHLCVTVFLEKLAVDGYVDAPSKDSGSDIDSRVSRYSITLPGRDVIRLCAAHGITDALVAPWARHGLALGYTAAQMLRSKKTRF